MGVGHVPAGEVPQAGQGHELSRRQHRGARAFPAPLGGPLPLARFGEAIAADYLSRRGFQIVERNRVVGRGELDLIARLGTRLIAVEVKTRRGRCVIEAFTPAKARQVRRLAGRLGIGRVDLVGVGVGEGYVEVTWLPEVA